MPNWGAEGQIGSAMPRFVAHDMPVLCLHYVWQINLYYCSVSWQSCVQRYSRMGTAFLHLFHVFLCNVMKVSKFWLKVILKCLWKWIVFGCIPTLHFLALHPWFTFTVYGHNARVWVNISAKAWFNNFFSLKPWLRVDSVETQKISNAFEERFPDFKGLELILLHSVTLFLSLLMRCHKSKKWNLLSYNAPVC